MKNHFYMSYSGNKREEVEKIYEMLNFENVETIVEPFAGTCAMSFYIWKQLPQLKFILNDNNPYFKEMYELMQDDERIKQFENEFAECCAYFKNDKEKYKEVIKRNNLMGWVIKHKVCCLTPGRFPIPDRPYKETINLKSFPVYEFFRNADIEFYSTNFLNMYEKYKDNEKNLFLLDPPYINSNNSFYISPELNIYEYVYNNDIAKEKCKIYFILEDIWIIKLLFKKYIVSSEQSYEKNYNTTHKKTSHIIIYNHI